jgi:hypothetical protein
MPKTEQDKYLGIVNSGMVGANLAQDKTDDPEVLKQRTPSEVFIDHLTLRKDGKFDEDLRRNYAPDVILVSNYGTFHGFDGMRESATILAKNFPSLNYRFDSLLVNKSGAAFEEWTASSDTCEVNDGIDAFIIKDGKIKIQTVWYTAYDKITHEQVFIDA